MGIEIILRYTVATTWEMSFNRIKNDPECPEAAQLLHLFAFLNPDVILLDFIEAGKATLNTTLGDLNRNPVQMDRALRLITDAIFAYQANPRRTRCINTSTCPRHYSE